MSAMQPVNTPLAVDPSSELVQEDDILPFDKLLLGETWWRDHQQTLESHGYLLRPRLRPGLRFNDPPFFAVNEVVDFIRQTLEVSDKLRRSCSILSNWLKGLSFMHEKGVAHR